MATLPSRDTYNPEVAGEICRRLANGEKLRRICGPDRAPGIPERVTVYNWLNRHPPFMRAYVIARRAQAELYLEEMVEIADGHDDTLPHERDVRRDWLRVKSRHWTTVVITTKLYPVVPEEPPHLPNVEHAAARIAAIFEAGRRRQIEREGETPELKALGEELAVLMNNTEDPPGDNSGDM